PYTARGNQHLSRVLPLQAAGAGGLRGGAADDGDSRNWGLDHYLCAVVDDGTLVSLQSIVTSLGPQGVQTTEAVWTCGQRLAPGRQNMSTQKDHASIGRLAGCGLAGGLIGAMLPPMVGLGSNLFFREF